MKIRRIGMALAICFLMLGMSSEAEAAARPIHTVSVKVNSKLEPGGRLPSIGIGTRSLKDGEISVSGSNSKYHVTEAEWVDKGDKVIKAADEPRMKVTLEPADVGEDYFLASYKKSDVKVSGGTFVSARRDGDALVVTIRVNGVKGEYDPPPDAFWHEDNLGEARWEKPENTSGYYEAQLLRDGRTVYRLAADWRQVLLLISQWTDGGGLGQAGRTLVFLLHGTGRREPVRQYGGGRLESHRAVLLLFQ